jgi:hypothetical protein
VPDPDEALRLSGSVNPLLRRRAARQPLLPPAVLAQDDDPGVRRLLALHNAEAPPQIVLDAYLAGDRNDRAWIWERGDLPVDGLARFSKDPVPAVRRLAALDPQVSPELIAGMLDDPDEEVRRGAAGSPGLSTDRIVELLADAESAEYAAANQALPSQWMDTTAGQSVPVRSGR